MSSFAKHITDLSDIKLTKTKIRNRTRKMYIDQVVARWWQIRDQLKPPIINRVLTFGGGLGDHLLCSAIFRALRERNEANLWMMTDFPELFWHNPDVDHVVPRHDYYFKLASQARYCHKLTYTTHIKAEQRDMPLSHHFIANMAALLGLNGEITLRPYLNLTKSEEVFGKIATNQIAVHSSIASARYPILTKEWYPKRMQDVVNRLYPHYTCVQIGVANDPRLENTIDMRGKLSFRQTASVLANSQLFIGQVGFLMHLARAIDCRSVIVFGGREDPAKSGYSANTNIRTQLDCSPCWLWDGCPIHRECMQRITSDMVVEAVYDQLDRYRRREPLQVERVPIPDVKTIPELTIHL